MVKRARGVEVPLAIVTRSSGILDRHWFPLPVDLRISTSFLYPTAEV